MPVDPTAPLPKNKRKKKRRRPKGEGSLYLRGKTWWYKSADGKCHSTKTRIQADAVEWKNDFVSKMRVMDGRPVALSRVDVNEVLDDYISYLKLKGRKSVPIIEQGAKGPHPRAIRQTKPLKSENRGHRTVP
jgi:hypothetical protein